MAVKLTEPAIKAAMRSAAEQQVRINLRDPGQTGLQLRITPKGTLTWALFCRDSNSKPRRFLLGQYPEIGLAQARLEARAMREKVRQGADPIAKARLKRAAAQADTLGDLLILYERQQGANLRTWREYRQRIESVFARQLKTGLSELQLSTLQLAADQWAKPQSAAAAVRYLRPILKWAAAPGRAYVAKELTEITPPAIVARRERVLNRDELVQILRVLDRHKNAHAAALRFMLLTLARREEVCGATWREIDLEGATWTLPAERTKSARSHVVPLSRQAAALLTAIRPESPRPDALVFPTAGGLPLGNWDRATKRIMAASGTSGWHRHDARRTSATLLGELGVEPHVIEAALNHTHVGGQLAALYNRARYRPQVAAALQRLADALDGMAAGAAVVVPLRG